MYLVRVFYQPDPQSSCKLHRERVFKTLRKAKKFAEPWDACGYVTHIYEYRKDWFPV